MTLCPCATLIIDLELLIYMVCDKSWYTTYPCTTTVLSTIDFFQFISLDPSQPHFSKLVLTTQLSRYKCFHSCFTQSRFTHDTRLQSEFTTIELNHLYYTWLFTALIAYTYIYSIIAYIPLQLISRLILYSIISYMTVRNVISTIEFSRKYCIV